MLRAATIGLFLLAGAPLTGHAAVSLAGYDDTMAMLQRSTPADPDTHDCDAANLLRRLAGCSALIKSANASRQILSYAYGKRGLALFSLGEKRRAIADFDQAIRHDASNAGLYLARGTAWQHLGEHARAVEDLARAVEMEPDNAAAYGNLGVAWEKLGDDVKALENYDISLGLEPVNAIVLNNRGNVHARMGERRRAIADYDNALRIDPDYASAYYNRAGERCLVGEGGAAVSDYLQAIRLGERQRTALQDFLSKQGYYGGAAEVAPDPGLETALRRWSENACTAPTTSAESVDRDQEVRLGRGG